MTGSAASTRFASPVASFDPGLLLRPLRRTFSLSLGAAALLHGTIALMSPFDGAVTKTPRPLTHRFVKREPRLTKPLELRKIPRPKRVAVRRYFKPLPAARMDRVQATAAFDAALVVTRTAVPRISVSPASTAPIRLEPATDPAFVLTNSRVPENRIDMALEMLDLKTMDTGRYKAMVVEDETDRQAVRGFVKFAQVTSASANQMGWVQREMLGFDLLRDALNEYTGIHAELEGQITYDDSRLLEVPIVIPWGEPNESEMEHLTRYLLAGGFLFGPVTERMQEGLIKYGGLVRGQDFWSERLPESHPVFHSFFDLDVVPSGYWSGISAKWQGWLHTTGYFIDGRLAAIETSNYWGWFNHLYSGDSTRQLQMAVNVVVFALTQEGSMTQRLMQMLN